VKSCERVKRLGAIDDEDQDAGMAWADAGMTPAGQISARQLPACGSDQIQMPLQVLRVRGDGVDLIVDPVA
jgi:hypothetical protein